jgi:hypothetical protein
MTKVSHAYKLNVGMVKSQNMIEKKEIIHLKQMFHMVAAQFCIIFFNEIEEGVKYIAACLRTPRSPIIPSRISKNF